MDWMTGVYGSNFKLFIRYDYGPKVMFDLAFCLYQQKKKYSLTTSKVEFNSILELIYRSRSLIAIKIRHVCMSVSFLSHPRTSEKKTLQVVIYCIEHFGMLHIFKIFISFKKRDGIIIMIKYLNS